MIDERGRKEEDKTNGSAKMRRCPFSPARAIEVEGRCSGVRRNRRVASNEEPEPEGWLLATFSIWLRTLTRAESVVPPSWGGRLARLVAEANPASIAYALSSFSYSLAGLCLIAAAHEMQARVNSSYPWLLEGVLLVTQGLLSFTSDVAFLGRSCRARAVDRVLATTLTVLQVAKLPPHALGYAGFTPMPRYAAWAHLLWPVGVLFYFRSRRASGEKNFEDFLLWHSLWHAALPAMGAVVISLVLVYS